MTIDRTSDVVSDDRDIPGERALVAAAAAGDRDAFGELVLLHERCAVRTALAALGQQADAEDVAQDAFLLAWRKLPGFRGDASFRTWLLTIVWRQALAKRRVRQRWWQRLVPVGATGGDEAHFAAELSSDAPGPEQQAVDRSRVRETAAAIAGLSPKLRDTLLLAASGEHSYDEIGRLLGVATGTVKWRVAEARRLVTRRIGDRHED
jgi:RNA polymerase sigma-70 factor (ECF subfamily)